MWRNWNPHTPLENGKEISQKSKTLFTGIPRFCAEDRCSGRWPGLAANIVRGGKAHLAGTSLLGEGETLG